MARVFNGTNQYLSASSTLLSNEPIDMVDFFNADIITTNMATVSLGDGGGAFGTFVLQARGDIATDPVYAIKASDIADTGIASTSTGFTSTTWYTGGASFISNTSRSVFINGASKGTNTTDTPDPTPNHISIGAQVRSTVVNYFDGSIAEAYILDANMGDTVHAIVGLGYSPLWSMPISNIRGWYPLQNDNNNRVANGYPDLAPTGSPTDAIHPFNVIYPSIGALITL